MAQCRTCGQMIGAGCDDPEYCAAIAAKVKMEAATPTPETSPADEAQMALCHLDWISGRPGIHPHRVSVIRGALERLAKTTIVPG